MGLVWKNLELIEETYEQIFLKTHRIQANRVCLGDLTGVDFRGEKHPVNCPCEKKAAKERLDRERMERRRAEEEERKRLQHLQEIQEKREENQKKMDLQIEMKKKEFYKKMNGTESKSDSKAKYDMMKAKTSKIIDHFPDLRSGRSSLVIIDGEMKSLTSEFIEQDGMLIQEQSICSLDLAEVDLDDQEKEEKPCIEGEANVEDDFTDDEDEDESKQDVQIPPKDRSKDSKENNFEKFLDIMEIF